MARPIFFIRVYIQLGRELYSFSTIVSKDIDSIKIDRVSQQSSVAAKKSSTSAISRTRAAEKGKYSFHRRNAARLVAIHLSITNRSRRIEKDRSGEIMIDAKKTGLVPFFPFFFPFSLSLFPSRRSLRRIDITINREERI